jgi:hypothetical protein
MRGRGIIAAALLAASVVGAASGAGAQGGDDTERLRRIGEHARAAFAQRSTGPTSTGDVSAFGRRTGRDRLGDAGHPGADMTRLEVTYNATRVKLAVRMPQGTNPRTDPAWTGDTGIAGVQWAIDTTGDEQPEFFAFFGASTTGRLLADVVPADDDFFDRQVCRGATAQYGRRRYVVTAPSACIGLAPTIWVAAFSIYIPDLDDDDGGIDFAPEVGFLGPISGPPGGYRLTASDGGVFTYGSARYFGSLGHLRLTRPIVDAASTPTDDGYAMLGADGGVFTFGDARFAGSGAGLRPNGRFVGLAMTPSGRGYWLATSDGAVVAFGDARFFGSTAGFGVASEVVDIVATRRGRGYYLVTSNGGVLGFGDARFRGSAASLPLRSPIVTMATTPTGRGYYLVAADGGVFTYGDARFHGSTGHLRLSAPIVDVGVTTSGRGYTMVAADGGTFTFGDARYFGSAASLGLRAPIVALATR